MTNTGVYLVEPKVLEYIDNNEFIGFPDIIERCKKDGNKVGVYPITEKSWVDMGQIDELNKLVDKLNV